MCLALGCRVSGHDGPSAVPWAWGEVLVEGCGRGKLLHHGREWEGKGPRAGTPFQGMTPVTRLPGHAPPAFSHHPVSPFQLGWAD